MITKKIFVYCCAFNHSLVQNIFLTTIIFIQSVLVKVFALWFDPGILQNEDPILSVSFGI